MELQRLQEQLTAIQSEKERVQQQGLDTSFIDATIKDMEQQIAELESQQVRVQAQEADIESIKLPLDFNELLSDGEFKVTKANDMIIEVVKEDRRAQNVIHNEEIARINADWTDRINSGNAIREVLQEDIKELQKRLQAENEQAKLDAVELGELTRQLAQMGLEKKEAETTRDNSAKITEETNRLYNDACEKRNNAIRMLDEANGTIDKLRTDLDKLHSTKSNGITGTSISQTNRLAELQAEVTREKAARGIERWNQQYGLEIPVLTMPEIQPVNAVLEEEAPAEEVTFQEEVAAANDTGLQEYQGNSIMESVVSEESEIDLDIEVVFTLEYVRQLRILEEKVANIESKLVA